MLTRIQDDPVGDSKYPRLMIHSNTNIILFMTDGAGIVLHSVSQGQVVGTAVQDLDMSHYRDFTGILEMRN